MQSSIKRTERRLRQIEDEHRSHSGDGLVLLQPSEFSKMRPIELTMPAPDPVGPPHQERGGNDRRAMRFSLDEWCVGDAINRGIDASEIGQVDGAKLRAAHVLGEPNQVLTPVDV